MITRHGKLQVYYRRFKIIEDQTCTREEAKQRTPLALPMQTYTKERTQIRDIVAKSEDRSLQNQLPTKYLSEFRKAITLTDIKINQPIAIS